MRNCCTSNFASVVSVYIARACETHADCFVSGEHSGSTYCNVDGECAFDGCTDASDAVDGSCPTGVAGTQHQYCTDCGTAGSQSNGHLRFGNLCGQVRNAVDGGTYDVDCATEGRTISVVASGWLQLAEVEVYVSGDAWTDGSVNFAVSAATSACAVTVADSDGRPLLRAGAVKRQRRGRGGDGRRLQPDQPERLQQLEPDGLRKIVILSRFACCPSR